MGKETQENNRPEGVNIWLSSEEIETAGRGIVKVTQMPVYPSRIQPYSNCVGNEAYFFGTDSSLPPKDVERSVIEGIRGNLGVLERIKRVYLYFNENAERSEEQKPLRFFIYAGKDFPVDIVCDREPGSTREFLNAINLNKLFEHCYRVNFFHDSREDLSPRRRYETLELCVSAADLVDKAVQYAGQKSRGILGTLFPSLRRT